MVDIFFSLFAFIIALGVLVSIHEFGHFWVARRLGVKVLVFSIGYGKPIWRYRSKSGDQTEYVIGAIPLGGYVKMLDEREGDVAEGERGKAFNRQSVWKRMAIVAAGPAANFVLAVMAYWLTYTLGVTGIKPIIGDVAVNSAAYYAGFQKEDEILVFNEHRTPTWEAFRLALVDSAMETGQDVPARVKGQDGTERELFLFLEEPLLKSDGDPVTSIGLSVWRPEILPIIGGIQANGAAARAGLRAGDKILQVNGFDIATWEEWVMVIRKSADQQLKLNIERAGYPITLWIKPDKKKVDGRVIGFIGAYETQSADYLKQLRVTVHHGPLAALQAGFQKTWAMTTLTFQVLGKMLVGDASLKNISGPVTIAQYAGQSASISLAHYLNFLAMISVSLAVLNLLPIPVLDGGHLLFFMIEAIQRRPVPERAQVLFQQVGFAILVGLMSLAFYNDIMRLFS